MEEYRNNKYRRFLFTLYAYLLLRRRRMLKRRTVWVRSIFREKQRDEVGAQELIKEMRLTQPDKYFNYLRMTSEQFDCLLGLIGPYITKSVTILRTPIPAITRLALTLRYLACGDSMVSLSYQFRVGQSTVSNIILETTTAIWNILQPIILKQPTEDDWKRIANEFNNMWNFVNCIGAIDGKHIVIQAPPHSGSTFYNYHALHSIVLLAICDANYCFSLVNIGAEGRQSDGGIFQRSEIGIAFENNLLNVPSPENVSENCNLPFVLVGDEAFALRTYMMRPFSRNSLTYEKRIFNYRLSRARRIIESAFGILASRWRIFRKPIIASLKTVDNIIKASICLHNFVMKHELRKPVNERRYMFDRIEYNECGALRDIANIDIHEQRNAITIRNKFVNYFTNEGAVFWQHEAVQNNNM